MSERSSRLGLHCVPCIFACLKNWFLPSLAYSQSSALMRLTLAACALKSFCIVDVMLRKATDVEKFRSVSLKRDGAVSCSSCLKVLMRVGRKRSALNLWMSILNQSKRKEFWHTHWALAERAREGSPQTFPFLVSCSHLAFSALLLRVQQGHQSYKAILNPDRGDGMRWHGPSPSTYK